MPALVQAMLPEWMSPTCMTRLTAAVAVDRVDQQLRVVEQILVVGPVAEDRDRGPVLVPILVFMAIVVARKSRGGHKQRRQKRRGDRVRLHRSPIRFNCSLSCTGPVGGRVTVG